MQKSDFWFNFTCFGFKVGFLKKFLDRSVSFSARKRMSTLKQSKNDFWRAKNDILHKDTFKKGMFSWELSLPGVRVFCLDSFGMFRLFGKCLDFLGNV